MNPALAPDQVSCLLGRTAVDANASTGCRECPLGRDQLAGWGRLDVTAAIAQATSGRIPPADRLEANDDAGLQARALYGPRGGRVDATLDFWDDQSDVYRVFLRPGQRLYASLSGRAGAKLSLWRPGTTTVEGLSLRVQRQRIMHSRTRGAQERLAFTAPRKKRGRGWYYVQVKLGVPGTGPYTLAYAKR